jgi:mannose-6-phosphate isomerase-like protein (cupin superfamily)
MIPPTNGGLDLAPNPPFDKAREMGDKEARMAGQQAFPYDTRLNILHEALEKIDVKTLVDECQHPWYNQTLCRVNDAVGRLGVVRGEYHWHKHDEDDEFFFVVSGQFIIDLEGRTVTLNPQEGFVVPKGVMHRPRAPERTVILMVETAGIVPTGS